MEIENKINAVQTILYKGFDSTINGGLEWLNATCGEFVTFFKHLHKFLIFDSNSSSNLIETCFLCAQQIICCIKYMEKALKIESTNNIVLSTTRQFFLDRMIFCITKLKSTILPSSQKNDSTLTVTDVNFVTSMDLALDLIGPISFYSENEAIENIAEQNAQAMLESVKIRKVVDTLISQALAFTNICIPEDKKSLTAICQKVLRECISLEKECSFSEKEVKESEKNRRLKAEILETALYQLEHLINECLLRLVFQVLTDLKKDPVQLLRKMKMENCEQEIMDELICDFDLILDRLVQIGIFAIAFSTNYKTKSILRSCLASSESLDSYLIPSIFSHCEIHSSILEKHWKEEIEILENYVQEIIDTNSFCQSLIEIIFNCLEKLKLNFDKDLIETVLTKCEIFKKHLTVNSENLKLKDESALKLNYEDFILMLKECQAVLELSKTETIETTRITKRLRVLYSVLKKLHKSVKSIDTTNSLQQEIKNSDFNKLNSDELKDSNQFFESFGITPSYCSYFYKSKPDTSSMIMINKSEISSTMKLLKPKNKRKSLRIAMFKKQTDVNTLQFLDSMNDETLNLNITDILDQLTGLSGTLSAGVSNNFFPDDDSRKAVQV